MIIKGLDCSNSSMSYAIQLAGLKTLQEQPSFISISHLFCDVGWEKISALLLLFNLKTNWQLLRSEALSCLALNGLGTTFTANFLSFLFHNEPKSEFKCIETMRHKFQPLPYQPPREFAKHVEENMLSPLVVSTLQYPGTREEDGRALPPPPPY